MKRKWILIPVILIGFILAGMGSIKLLVTHIYNRQDCERFNIDNIECRTGINVPAVTDAECNCENNTKTSCFVIDTAYTNLNEYLVKHNFTKVDDQFAEAKGSNKNTEWSATLNYHTGDLYFLINYK
jgi:5'-3' exonuclease